MACSPRNASTGASGSCATASKRRPSCSRARASPPRSWRTSALAGQSVLNRTMTPPPRPTKSRSLIRPPVTSGRSNEGAAEPGTAVSVTATSAAPLPASRWDGGRGPEPPRRRRRTPLRAAPCAPHRRDSRALWSRLPAGEKVGRAGAEILDRTDGASRRPGETDCSTVVDQQVREVDPLLARHDLHQLPLHILGVFPLGGAQAPCEPLDVRVHDDADSDPECRAEHDVRGFPRHARECAELLHGPRHLP